MHTAISTEGSYSHFCLLFRKQLSREQEFKHLWFQQSLKLREFIDGIFLLEEQFVLTYFRLIFCFVMGWAPLFHHFLWFQAFFCLWFSGCRKSSSWVEYVFQEGGDKKPNPKPIMSHALQESIHYGETLLSPLHSQLSCDLIGFTKTWLLEHF